MLASIYLPKISVYVYVRRLVNRIWRFLTQRNTTKYDNIFVPQKELWDCGLSCCYMILKWANLKVTVDDELINIKKSSPFWTIELFALLSKYDIDVKMYTLFKGVNPTHQNIKWYIDGNEREIEYIRDIFVLSMRDVWDIIEVQFILSLIKTLNS